MAKGQAAANRFEFITRPILSVALIALSALAAVLAVIAHSDSLLAVAASAILLGTFSVWPPKGRKNQWGTLLPLIAAILPFGLLTGFRLESVAPWLWLPLSVASLVITAAGASLLISEGWGKSAPRKSLASLKALKETSFTVTQPPVPAPGVSAGIPTIRVSVILLGLPILEIRRSSGG